MRIFAYALREFDEKDFSSKLKVERIKDKYLEKIEVKSTKIILTGTGETTFEIKQDGDNVIVVSCIYYLFRRCIAKTGERVKGHSYLTVFGKERLGIRALKIHPEEFNATG